MRRLSVIILLIAAAFFSAFVFYTFSKSQPATGDPLSVVPADADVIFLVHKSEGHFRTGGLSGEEHAVVFQNCLRRLDSLCVQDDRWNEHFDAVVHYIRNSNAEQSGCTVIALKGEVSDELAFTMLGSLAPASWVKTPWDGALMWRSDNLFAAFRDQLMLLAGSSSVLEEALRCTSEQSVAGNANYIGMLRTASSDSPYSVVYRRDNEYWVLDLQEQTEGPSALSGYVFPDSSGAFWNIPSSSVTPEFPSVVPAGATVVDACVFPDLNTGIQWVEAKQPPQARDYWNGWWTSLADSCQCDPNEALLAWRSSEWGSFAINNPDGRSARYWFIRAEEDSLNLIDFLGPLVGTPELVTRWNVYPVKWPEAFRRHLSTSVEISPNFLIGFNGYVILAENRDDFIPFFLKTGRLSDDAIFTEMWNQLRPSGGRLVFERSQSTAALPSSAWKMHAGDKALFTHGIASGENRRAMIHIAGIISDQGQRGFSKPEQTVQNSIPPVDGWLVRNHNTGEKELLWQGADHVLHRSGRSSAELWSRSLDSPIIGAVHEVDALANGKLQIAFCTSGYIYVIDRNGRDLSGFPVKLPSAAQSPLAVFDYDNNRKYRLLVGLEAHVVNYTIEGKPTDGWNYEGNGTVREIKHLRTGTEDHLIMLIELGSGHFIRSVKRNGTIVAVDDRVRTRWSGWCIQEGTSFASSSFMLRSGTEVFSCGFQSDSKKPVLTVPEDASVVFADIDFDRKEEILVATENKVTVYTASGNVLAELPFEGRPSGSCRLIRTSSTDMRIGVSTEDGRFYLFSSSGRLLEGYPKPGPFRFFEDASGNSESEAIFGS